MCFSVRVNIENIYRWVKHIQGYRLSFISTVSVMKPHDRLKKMDKTFKNTAFVTRPESKPEISVVLSSVTLQDRKGKYAGKKAKNNKKN